MPQRRDVPPLAPVACIVFAWVLCQQDSKYTFPTVDICLDSGRGCDYETNVRENCLGTWDAYAAAYFYGDDMMGEVRSSVRIEQFRDRQDYPMVYARGLIRSSCGSLPSDLGLIRQAVSALPAVALCSWSGVVVEPVPPYP